MNVARAGQNKRCVHAAVPVAGPDTRIRVNGVG